jgi:hypothetical protein
MRFALWPNLTQPWADALALARHAGVTGWDGVYIAEIAGADQKLLGGVSEFTPRTTFPREATREQWGRMMARHVRRSQASSAILRRREPNLVDFVELLIADCDL